VLQPADHRGDDDVIAEDIDPDGEPHVAGPDFGSGSPVPRTLADGGSARG
jgi:hypothetical protein